MYENKIVIEREIVVNLLIENIVNPKLPVNKGNQSECLKYTRILTGAAKDRN